MKHQLLFLLAALAGAPLHAADSLPATPAGDRLQYPAEWYSGFAPRTAIDMVRQTPGFALEEGQARRGLAGALGNVLIDGRRPVAKSQTLEEILQRIPAAQVERIEILRGAEAAGDASGQAVLLNVVRTPFTAQGWGSAGFEYAAQDKPMPNGTLAWTGRAHSMDYALGASSYSFARELPGTRRLTDADGEFAGTRGDLSPRDYSQYSLNGESGMDMAGGRLRLTGKASYSRYHEDSTVTTYDSSTALLGADFNPFTQTIRGAEFGGHFDRQAGDWQLASALLLTRGDFASEITSTHSDATGAVSGVFAQRAQRNSGESILRATLARELAPAHRIELGIEGALNTLDANLALTFDFGGGPFPIPVPNSNVRIEEKRSDAFVNYGWRVSERWSLDGRLAGEYSRLTFSGDSDQVVTFAFAKPSLQVTRDFGKSNQLRLRIFRDVGQLDFTDFVSSVSLADARVDGGNPDLRPQTEWSAELSADLRPGSDVALSLAAFHRWVSDAADFTPVGPPNALVDAPGNIGDARVYGAHLTTRVPLRVLRSASLTVDTTWQHSQVTDPLTLRERTISEFQELELAAGIRQDLPRFTWGFNYTCKSPLSKYLLHEVDQQRASPSLDAFVELPIVRGLRLRAAAVSLSGQAETRERVFFAPDRRGALASAERGEREPGRWYQVSISGSF
ncbi:MAG TPA: TonB-dependent receptor [Steroidobacteraceae bacterium]|nr:TonB-dependent receptor [Steroidobacteraceae bacterium]